MAKQGTRRLVRVSVIVSTYDNHEVLRLILRAFEDQDCGDFEVIVVDNGSAALTRGVVEEMQHETNLAIEWVWHPHQRDPATLVGNRGVAVARGEYLVFMDGTSIPRRSFVRRHRELAELGYWVVGNRVQLSPHFTAQVLEHQWHLPRFTLGYWGYAWMRGWIDQFLPLISLGSWYNRYRFPTRWQEVSCSNLGVWKRDFQKADRWVESKGGGDRFDLLFGLVNQKIFRKEGSFALPELQLWRPANHQNLAPENYRKLAVSALSSVSYSRE